MEIENNFEELSLIDPSDWNNIPSPLVKAIVIIKKCLLKQMDFIYQNNQKVFDIERKIDYQIKDHEFETKNMKKLIFTMEDIGKQNVKDLNQTININQSSIQQSLDSEISFLKKNIDGKISHIEQQLENTNRVLNSLPTSAEVDGKIKYNIIDAGTILRKEIKEDIKDNIIAKEVLDLNKSIQILDQKIKVLQK